MDSKIKEIEKHLEEVMNILEIPKTISNQDTPHRVAKMWCNELFQNRNNNNIKDLDTNMKLFPNEYSSDMIIIRDIEFTSTCEHHWLPFIGKATIGYIPDNNVVGLSKIPRVVKYFSKKPQLQEQLTTEIGSYLYKVLNPKAIFVEVEAKHECVSCRGIENNCSTYTIFKKTKAGYEDSYNEFIKLKSSN